MIIALLIAVVLVAVLVGCKKNAGGDTQETKNVTGVENMKTDGANGTGGTDSAEGVADGLTLCGIEYSFHSGTMMGVDESYIINEKEIVNASFFPEESGNREPKIVENVAITEAQWKNIEKAALNLMPVLEVFVPNDKKVEFPDIEVLDGGDKTTFAFEWKDKDGNVTRTEYYYPNDRRVHTYLDTVRETADPIGREIVWYGEPEITGIYLTVGDSPITNGKGYSFQCSRKSDDENAWYLFCYYIKDGKNVSISEVVGKETWDRVHEFIKKYDTSKWDSAKSDGKVSLTYYMDDGKQPRFVPSNKECEEIREFFLGIIEELSK
ncbi:MAG: hypothetical protein Q4B67_04160 [Eubacteriales bacterium]|nr:hypothetical protein [Eubacteriales bacterium]